MRTIETTLADIRLEAYQGEIFVSARGDVPRGKIDPVALRWLARLIGAPADYLRSLPATLAAQNLNHGISRGDQSRPLAVMVYRGRVLVNWLR